MQLTIANNKALLTDDVSAVIFAQSQVPITINSAVTIGTSIVLMTATGKTLAMTNTSDGTTATLDTNTVECYEYVQSLTVNATKGAFLVVGCTDSVIAVADVQIAKNPIADIAPPTESAPVYPTQQEFIELLAQLEAMRETVSEMSQGVIEDINDGKQTALDAISTATTQGVDSVNTTATEATTTINTKVTEAEAHATQATRSATQAQTSANSASRSATQAENAKIEAQHALNNGCFYTAESYGAYTEGETIQPQFVKETTAYAIDFGLGAGALSCTIDLDMLYPLLRPQDVNINSCAVIWLWIRNWHDVPVEVTFHNNVAFVGSMPSFGARTEALFAIFGAQSLWNPNAISGIKHFIANLQFERNLDTGEPL